MKNNRDKKLIAFDLDGTLTQHKTPLSEQNREVLDRLGRKYRLLMVGAGQCIRIFRQMGEYPIDIIGKYGMQLSQFDRESGKLVTVYDEHLPCDRESIEKRITALREQFGYTDYAGESVEYHVTGNVTFPLLGTAAKPEDKLAFDPDRAKRRIMYPEVKKAFPDYMVFIGGSSSFDFAPVPYDKYYALDRYCKRFGLSHEEVVYVGDDYGTGGNDEAVYRSDFRFICVDDYTRLASCLKDYLEN